MLDKAESILVLDGDLTMRSASRVKTLIEAALAKGKNALQIHIADGSPVDLTLAQILLASRASGDKSGCPVVLTHPATGSLLLMLQRGGLLNGPEAERFWLHAGITR